MQNFRNWMTQWTHFNDQPHTSTKAHNLYTITNLPKKWAWQEGSSWTDWSICYSCVTEQTGQVATAVSLNRLIHLLQLCHRSALSATEPAPTVWGYAYCVTGGISDRELMQHYLTWREVGVPIGRLTDRDFWKCAHSTSQGVIIQSVLKTSSAFLIQ
jgi:hypothetical protein